MSETEKKLIEMLDNLLIYSGANSISLNTEDGLVIATNSKQNEDIEEQNTNFAAISASILSMAERGIEIINTNKILEQIKIDAGVDAEVEENIDEDFTILITRVISNVLLQIVFSKKINIGLIQFESSKTINKIRELIQADPSGEIFESIGSLL